MNRSPGGLGFPSGGFGPPTESARIRHEECDQLTENDNFERLLRIADRSVTSKYKQLTCGRLSPGKSDLKKSELLSPPIIGTATVIKD